PHRERQFIAPFIARRRPPRIVPAVYARRSSVAVLVRSLRPSLGEATTKRPRHSFEQRGWIEARSFGFYSAAPSSAVSSGEASSDVSGSASAAGVLALSVAFALVVFFLAVPLLRSMRRASGFSAS